MSQEPMTPRPTLTEQEVAYLDRFCYEVEHFLHGPGSVFSECPGRYQDLGALTNFAPAEVKARWSNHDREPPPVAPFPWKSLEALSARSRELRSWDTPV